MKTPCTRRHFLKKGTQAGMACCLMMFGGKLQGMEKHLAVKDDEIPNPEELCYCGYKCPDDCKFLKATLENNTDLKKEAYDEWKIKDRYGVGFEADEIFCYTCKPGDKPEGVVLINCTVRSCTIEKNHECCIQCNELEACEKDLWKRFPRFKELVIEMQNKYQAVNDND